MDVTVTQSGICDVSFYENAITILGVFVAAIGIGATFAIVWQGINFTVFKSSIDKRLRNALKDVEKSKMEQAIFVRASVNFANGNIHISLKAYDEAIICMIRSLCQFTSIRSADNANATMFTCLDIIEHHDKALKNSKALVSQADELIRLLSEIPTEYGSEIYSYLSSLK